jgi:hypothetical protein
VEREAKVNIGLMYFLHKNEYRIFKPAERRKIKRMKPLGYNTYLHGNVTRRLSV